VPGEKTSPTQPFPTKPPAYARNYLQVPDGLIDFTPELRAQALEVIQAIQSGAVAVHSGNARDDVEGVLGAIGAAGNRDELARIGLRS